MNSKSVSYEIDGPLFIIRLHDPRYLNSITFNDFLYIAQLLEMADKDDSIFFTLFQSTGRFFSSGGKFESVLESESDASSGSVEKLSNLFGTISTQNVLVANTFLNHSKVLICCMNGPAVGLSASLILLCDIVYSRNDSVYCLFPFSNLGFVAELSSSVTLPRKLGVNLTNEHLIFSTPITYIELKEQNIIVKNYNMEDTEKFNKQIVLDIKSKSKYLYKKSFPVMKKLIMSGVYKEQLIKSQSLESAATLPFWRDGEPQRRFVQLKNKERRHKL